MRAGTLDRRITLLRAAVEQDSSGDEVPTWFTVATVWASRKSVAGTERNAGSQIVSLATDVFEIRWSNQVKGVTTKDRILFDGREFNIESVSELRRREGLALAAYTPAERPVAG